MKFNKKAISLIMIGALALGTLAGCGASSASVATVNGKSITKDYFDKNYKVFEYEYTKSNGADALTKENNGVKMSDTAKSQILDQLVQEQVIYDYMIAQGKTAKKEDVDTSLNTFKEGLKSNTEYSKFLSDNKIDDKFIRNKLERMYLMNDFDALMTSESALKPEEPIVRASHILVDDEKEAKSIYDQLKKGANFASLAKSKSKDGSAAKGGDLGYFVKGMMVTEFENAAFSTKVGKISAPVKSQFGYHIIKVTDSTVFGKLTAKSTKMKTAEFNDMISNLQSSVSSTYVSKKYSELETGAKVTKNLEEAKK